MKTISTALLITLFMGCHFDQGGEDLPADDPGASDPGTNDPGGTDPGNTDPGHPDGPGYPCAGNDENSNPGLGGDIRCFPAEDTPEGNPLVVIEYAFELYDGVDAVHVRLTFDPGFNDNQYGDTALGWEFRDKGHKFKDLVGSDHADVVLLDATGATVFDMSLDYISEDPSKPCGWGSLGPMGGDGRLRIGKPGDILGWSSSLDRNLNERGYCAYTESSPATDVSCTPSTEAPDWDYRIVFDVWVRERAFGAPGFGTAHMNEVHASPSKADSNTVTVTPGDCPPDWCNDPDGCEPGNGGGGECTDSTDCATGEFCGEGHCVPVIE